MQIMSKGYLNGSVALLIISSPSYGRQEIPVPDFWFANQRVWGRKTVKWGWGKEFL